MVSRQRHQSGEAVEQLERYQELRAAAAGALLRRVVDEVLEVSCELGASTPM